jgi:hypothetical protein
VVVAVLGLEDDARVAAGVVEEGPVAPVDALHHVGHLVVHAGRAAHLERALSVVVHEPVEAEQQVVAVGLRERLQLRARGRVGLEVRQTLGHLGGSHLGPDGADHRSDPRRKHA